MTMQNEADNIALSLATYKARVLNFLGNTNYLMGIILSLGMNPSLENPLIGFKTQNNTTK